MKLIIKAKTKREINVSEKQQVCDLFKILNITDKKAKFICNGFTFAMAQFATFEELGIKEGNTLYVSYQGLSANFILESL